MAKERTEDQIDKANRYGTVGEWALAITVGVGSAAVAFFRTVREKFHTDAKFKEGFHAITTAKENELARLAQLRIQDTVDLYGKHATLSSNPAFTLFSTARDTINNLIDKAGGWAGEEQVRKAATPYAEAFAKLHDEQVVTLKQVANTTKFKELTRTYIDKVGKTKSDFYHRIDQFADNIYGIHSSGIRGYVHGTIQRYKMSSPDAKKWVHSRIALAFVAGAGLVAMIVNQLNSREKLNANDKEIGDANRKLDVLIAEHAAMESHPIKVPGLLAAKNPIGAKSEGVLAKRAEAQEAVAAR